MSEKAVSQVILGILGLTLVGAGAASFVWGIAAFLLGCAAGALSLVIVLMWSSLQNMDADEEMGFEQALSYAAPSTEEEQKRAVIRTIKDLEYELSVGKISQKDFDQMSAEARSEAKRLIALADESMKERIHSVEKRVARHVKEAEESASKKDVQQSDSHEEDSMESESSTEDSPSSSNKTDQGNAETSDSQEEANS